MHRLHFKYDYQAAILENQLSAITPELMAVSTPNFNHRYICLLGIFYGFFTRGEHYGPVHFIQDSLEEAIKVQKTLDPIPTKRASWPDNAKKQTTPLVQSTYSGRVYQGRSSRPKPKGNAPRNDGFFGR
jgi:hypothetical protein